MKTRLAGLAVVTIAALLPSSVACGADDPQTRKAISRGLDWLASQQTRMGRWTGNGGRYPTAMTAMAAMALLCEGSTTTQGKYSANIQRAVNDLLGRARSNGLIGDPAVDDRYTYGHGFAMLFLSQVLGEEEDAQRRERLIEVLEKAVVFSGRAQTAAGGWGYVSAKDGNNFDEGSTTITQVQALRGCRNAGIPVPKEIIEKAVKYIEKCTGQDGGVQYNSRGGSGRPAITAASLACLFNAGEYDSQYVKKLMNFCEDKLDNISSQGFGHWHYAHYYYAQVQYRRGGKHWKQYKEKIFKRIISEAADNGSWTQGYIGPVYTTSINLTILQLPDAALPIYQR